MNVFDWVFIAALALGVILGLIKGFLKPLLSAIGFVVVTFGASLLAPTVQGMLTNAGMEGNFVSLLAIAIALIGLMIIWIIVSVILRKIITGRKGMGIINRVVGAVLGALIVYLLFAVFVAFMVSLGGLVPTISEKLGPEIEASWIRNHIYTDKGNFFGNWIINDMAQRLLEIVGGQQPDASAAKILSGFIA